MNQSDPFLQSLAIEYLQLVDATQSGLYSAEVTEQLNIDRSVIHEQLLMVMGETRESDMDMVEVCRGLVMESEKP